jgi:hypothetical protein
MTSRGRTRSRGPAFQRGSAHAALVAVALALGCGGREQGGTRARDCASSADCSDGKVCVFLKGQGPSFKTIPPPLPCNSAGLPTCASNADCAAGAVCRKLGLDYGNYSCPSSCVTDCAAAGANPCPMGTLCGPSGACQQVRCDQPAHPGCPTGMTCDPSYVAGANAQEPPGRYSLFGTDQYPQPAVLDAGPIVSERQEQAIAAGCVFLRCNESGSFDCAPGFGCDISHAAPSASGCLPIPCSEWGACSSDQFVCEPTSSQKRPRASDVHGCVSRNCEEGLACPPYSACDFSRPGNEAGCAYLRCDEPGGGCPSDFKCEPNPQPLPSGLQPGADQSGCSLRRCDLDGLICRDGLICAPDDPAAALTGCAAPPASPSGGAAGQQTAGGSSGAPSSDGATPSAAGSPGSDASVPADCLVDADCAHAYCVKGHCTAIAGVCR